MGLSFFQQLQKRNRDFEIEIDGLLLPVQVKENDRAKRITLRLSPNGGKVKVTTPGHVGDDEIEAFVHRNRNWLAVRLSRMPDRIWLEEGATIPFKGVDHRIQSSGKVRGTVRIVEHEDGPFIEVPGDPASISRKLLAFLKREARRELDRAVNGHAAKMTAAGKQAMAAALAQDADALFDAGGQVYQACRSCHIQFWADARLD